MKNNNYHDDRDIRNFKTSDEEFAKKQTGLDHNAIGLIAAVIVAIICAYFIGFANDDFKTKFLSKAMNVVIFWSFSILFTVFFNTRRFKQDEVLFKTNSIALGIYLGAWIIGTALAVVLGN